MSITESAGLFAEYYLNIKNSLTNFEEEIEKIKLCKNDLERVKFLENFKGVIDQDEKLAIRREFEGKSAELAADFKEKGNLAFKSKQWLEAMVLYTKSYIALPEDKGKCFFIFLFRRENNKILLILISLNFI